MDGLEIIKAILHAVLQDPDFQLSGKEERFLSLDEAKRLQETRKTHNEYIQHFTGKLPYFSPLKILNVITALPGFDQNFDPGRPNEYNLISIKHKIIKNR